MLQLRWSVWNITQSFGKSEAIVDTYKRGARFEMSDDKDMAKNVKVSRPQWALPSTCHLA